MSSMMSSWAGEYECSGPCGRKRLIADNFSKSSLTNFKVHSKPLRCKNCIEESQRAEQNIADDEKATPTSGGGAQEGSSEDITMHPCSACTEVLPSTSFNRNQLSKGAGKQRCKQCVQAAESASAAAIEEGKAAKLSQAEERLRLAEASNNTVEILAASSALAALEAQAVTGMSTVVGGGRRGGGGRGGGTGKGRGRGRDRGGGSCWDRR